jgi:hypothetical protein
LLFDERSVFCHAAEGPFMGVTSEPTLLNLERMFPGDGEMAQRMPAFDWSRSAIGAPQDWPQNLRIALGLCLTSRFPAHVWWGPSRTLFYNDACRSLLGPAKHPAVLGRSGCDAWPESWDTIGPMIERVFAHGDGLSADLEMLLARSVAQ